MTLAVLGLAALALAQGWPPRNGSSLPSTCATGQSFWLTTTSATSLYECTSTDTWEQITAGGAPGASSLPAGAIILMLSACPTGFSEVSSLAGKFVLGTTNVAGDVTGTGGTDTVSSVLNHTHTVNVTDPGHTHTQNSHNHTQNSFAPRIINSGTAGTVGVQGASAASNANASNSATTATNQAATATNQTASTGVTASTVNPAGGVASFDNRPAFVRVIFCAAD